MIEIFALSPKACPDSYVVFVALCILGILIGLNIAHLIKEGKFRTATIIFVSTLFMPLFLWIIDGYSAVAQLLVDDDISFKCDTEGVFSQLSRLNYGIWHLLIILSIFSFIGLVYFKKDKKHV